MGLCPKEAAATVEGNDAEGVPVPFCYDVDPSKGNRANIFRPNTVQGDPKVSTAGALWLGKLDSIPQSKLVDVLWEAISLGCLSASSDSPVCRMLFALHFPAAGPDGRKQNGPSEAKAVPHRHHRVGSGNLGKADLSSGSQAALGLMRISCQRAVRFTAGCMEANLVDLYVHDL